MSERIEDRLKTLGVELPEPSRPGANYVQFVRTGELLFLTGQLSQWNGERRFVGKLGREFGVEEGQQAARLRWRRCSRSVDVVGAPTAPQADSLR